MDNVSELKEFLLNNTNEYNNIEELKFFDEKFLEKIEHSQVLKSLIIDSKLEAKILTAWVSNLRKVARRSPNGGIQLLYQANYGGKYPFDPKTACGKKGISIYLPIIEITNLSNCLNGNKRYKVAVDWK